MKKILLSIVGIAALGAIGWFAFGRGASPQQVLAQMQENMMDVNSMKFSGVMQVTGNFDPDKLPTSAFMMNLVDTSQQNSIVNGNMTLGFTGMMNKSTEGVLEGSGDLNLEYTSDNGNGNVGVSFRSMGNTSYVQISDVNISTGKDESQQLVDSLKSSVQGKWIKFDNTPVQSQKDMKEFVQMMDDSINVEVVGSEMVRGVETTHMTFNIDAQTVYNNMLQEKGDQMTIEEKQQLQKHLEKFAQLNMHTWVGQNDAMLYKFQVVGPMQDEAQGYAGTLNFMIEMYDYNVPNTVVQPENALNFEELIGQFLGNMMMDLTEGINLEDVMQVDDNTQVQIQMPAFGVENMDIEALQQLYTNQEESNSLQY